jgi:hypothetical protein
LFEKTQQAHLAAGGDVADLVQEQGATIGNFDHAAPRSPWQNPYAERLIASIRRECLNHVIVYNDRHLKRLLRSYFAYYHAARTHLALEKQCPQRRPIEQSSRGKIIAFPHVGGLHQEYRRAA